MDAEAVGSQLVVNLAFISQACLDIKRKLQKTERVLSMSSPQLTETADSVLEQGHGNKKEI